MILACSPRLRAHDPLKHGRLMCVQDIAVTLFSDSCSVLAVDGRAEVGKKWWRSGLKSVNVNDRDIT